MAPSTDPHHEALAALHTEAVSPLADTMDSLDTFDLCVSFNREEARVPSSITSSLPAIAALIDDLVPRLRSGGRLVYVGAGNSGRVAFMDCTELFPTFSADPEQFLVVVAGGSRAITEAVEGAEDLYDDGVAKMQELRLSSLDTVIGIAASGRTPFVLGALNVAKECHALTAAITNCRPSALEKLGVTHCIAVLVGPEFLTGSTRLKAGSCAKQVLNMTSTCAMVKLGKTYRGLMVDVRASNEKLRARGRRIVRQVCQGHPLMQNIRSHIGLEITTGRDDLYNLDTAIDALIQRCKGNIKLSCAVGLSGLDPDTARERLVGVDGNLHAFVRALPTKTIPNTPDQSQQEHYFLCVDGGGTKCAVSIASRHGVVAHAVAGGCNLNTVTLAEAVDQIRSAIDEAVARMNGSAKGPWPRFAKVWAGVAGLHHSRQARTLTCHLELLLGVSSKDGSLSLTCDTTLLSSCLGVDSSIDSCVTLIAGTGAVATAFERGSTGEIAQVGRAGGWGHLFGDAGSAFYIGQRAIQTVLASLEESQGGVLTSQRLSPLQEAILQQLNCDKRDLLSTILSTPASQHSSKLLIGSLARVVTSLGFRPISPDQDAVYILHDAAECLVDLLERLVKARVSDPGRSILVLTGAMMKLEAFRHLVLQKCRTRGVVFKRVLLVENPSQYAVEFLAGTRSTVDGAKDSSFVPEVSGGSGIGDDLGQSFPRPSILLEQRQGDVISV